MIGLLFCHTLSKSPKHAGPGRIITNQPTFQSIIVDEMQRRKHSIITTGLCWGRAAWLPKRSVAVSCTAEWHTLESTALSCPIGKPLLKWVVLMTSGFNLGRLGLVMRLFHAHARSSSDYSTTRWYETCISLNNDINVLFLFSTSSSSGREYYERCCTYPHFISSVIFAPHKVSGRLSPSAYGVFELCLVRQVVSTVDCYLGVIVMDPYSSDLMMSFPRCLVQPSRVFLVMSSRVFLGRSSPIYKQLAIASSESRDFHFPGSFLHATLFHPRKSSIIYRILVQKVPRQAFLSFAFCICHGIPG
jgi:hypothetical protein